MIYNWATRTLRQHLVSQATPSEGVACETTSTRPCTSLVPRLSLNIRKGGGEERESLANFIVTFRSGCPLFFRTVNKVLTHIHRHRLARLSICSANALRMRGFTPCSHGHVVVVTTTEPESAERLPYAKFARLSSLCIIESLGTRLPMH